MSLCHGTKVRKLLGELCKGWGGELIRLRPKEFNALFHVPDGFTEHGSFTKALPGYYSAPFTGERLGINWERRQVIYSGRVLWPGIIHEMGHVFVDRSYLSSWSAEEYDKDTEFSWFGWEYLMARKVGGVMQDFYYHNNHYGVDWTSPEGDVFHDFEAVRCGGRKVMTVFFDHTIEVGQKAGCIGPERELRAMR